MDRDDAERLLDDPVDPQPVAERLHERDDHAEADDDRERRGEERAPPVGRGRVEHELVAGRDLVEPRERDARVGEEMDGVPPLVGQAAARDRVRGGDDRDQEGGADRRGDHPRVDAAPEHRPELAADRELVQERVAPDDEHDVHDDEVDARVPVPAVPAGEPVEPDGAFERRDARQKNDLDEREVGAQEPGEPPDACESVSGGVHALDVAAVPPEPHEPQAVADDECADGDSGSAAAPQRTVRGPRKGAWTTDGHP